MSKPSLRKLSRDSISNEELEEILAEVNATSDRNACIILSSLLQASLCYLIIHHLENKDTDTLDELYEHGGPLSSFYSQIHLAYAMGLLNKKAKDSLNIIRKIRNVFAHSAKPLKFSSDAIQDHIALLDCRSILGGAVEIKEDPRSWFIVSAVLTNIYLVKATRKKVKSRLNSARRKISVAKRKMSSAAIMISEIESKLRLITERKSST